MITTDTPGQSGQSAPRPLSPRQALSALGRWLLQPATPLPELARLLSGFRIAARDRLVKRILIAMTVFSFFSVTFVGLMPAIAASNFGIRPKSVGWWRAMLTAP